MTANAMKGDREKCLTAGMDDYVAKPIRPETVFEAIERVLPNPGRSDTRTAIAAPQTTEDEPG
jgi:protein-histidine pros-kinase